MPLAKSYFEQNSQNLALRYDALSFEEIHYSWSKGLTFEGLRVLDVGCGSGRDAIHMACEGAIVSAVDQSAGFLQIAKQKPGAERVQWFHQSLPSLSNDLLVKKHYDLILLSAVLMFLPQDQQEQALLALLPSLSRKGKMVITFKSDKNDSMLYSLSNRFIDTIYEKGFRLQTKCGGDDLFAREEIKWDVFVLSHAY